MSVLTGPSYDLQQAICTCLRDSENMQSLIGEPMRLYVDPPANATFPFVTLGQDQVSGKLAQDFQGAEVLFELHIWGRKDDFAGVKSIGATANALISALSGDLTEYRITRIEFRGARHEKYADGVTNHGVYTWRALLAPLT